MIVNSEKYVAGGGHGILSYFKVLFWYLAEHTEEKSE